MRLLTILLVIAMAVGAWGLIHQANREQAGYDACWAKGGVQVKTVKFNNGTACIDRGALIKEER